MHYPERAPCARRSGLPARTVAPMSDQRGKADDLEQRYVAEHAETEELLEGLDPDDTERDKVDAVEAVGTDGDADGVEKMARKDT